MALIIQIKTRSIYTVIRVVRAYIIISVDWSVRDPVEDCFSTAL